MEVLRIGLIVNPIAGMGGRVGLKGTDGAETLRLALEKGAVPLAEARVKACLTELFACRDSLALYAGSGVMGERVARDCGFNPVVVGTSEELISSTSALDTRDIANKMMATGLDLIIFAGGDGTARDIYQAVGEDQLVIGIPAGVKIHSAVFASSPQQAGRLICSFITDSRVRKSERLSEVMDIDEDAYRNGVLKARLFGYLRIPYERNRVQGLKAGTPASDQAAQGAIAVTVAEIINSEPDTLFLIGAGSTTRAVLSELGESGAILGIDAYLGGKLIGTDLGENEILQLLESAHLKAKIVITPIGGQGFIFGRGNQQFSPDVIKRVKRDNLLLLASPSKLHALEGEPLLLDTGDVELDRELEGYYRIVSGYRQYVVYRVKQG